ncbi:hypothetical protein [Ekhidna sp.]
MNLIYRLSFKLMVVQFYKRNAGLLFFFFIAFFGIIPPQYLVTTHLGLIHAQIDSPLLSLCVLVFWASYSIRCTNFICTTNNKYWDSTTSYFRSFSPKTIRINLLLVFSVVYLPITIYGILVASVAFFEENSIYGSYVLTSLLIITLCNTIYAYHFSQGRKTLVFPYRNIYPSIKINFHFNWILLSYYWRERTKVVLLLKVISYVGFNLFIIRNKDFFREDYFVLFLLLLGSFNSLLIFSGQKFLEERAQFLRNLPISLFARGMMNLITAIVYFIPELLFLIGMNHEILTYESKFLYYTFLISHFVLQFALLYSENFSYWKYIKYLVVMLFGFQMMIAVVPIYIVIVINLILSAVIFHDSYLKYEHQTSLMKD